MKPIQYIVGYGYASRWQGSHRGEDIVSPTGTPILAIADGEVLKVWNGGVSGYHQAIVISYPALGVDVLYGHIGKSTMLTQGKKFRRGEVIAKVGTRADAANTDPHAHVQVALASNRFKTLQLGTAFNSVAIDPRPVRTKAEPEPKGIRYFGRGGSWTTEAGEGDVTMSAEGAPESWGCAGCG